MKILPFTFILLFGSLHSFSQTVTGSFTHSGQTRTYRVHLPPGFSTATSRPLVLNLHGLTSNAQQQEIYSGFNTIADTANIIVVYPNALNNTSGVPEWNAYGLGSTDDIGFLLALIDSMQNQYNIDLNRVYCIGLSNGGYMSYRMACTNSCRFAAIASVAGLLIENILTPCNISRPVPLMHIHGTADGTVAYSGVAATISSWRTKDACPSTATTSTLPDINTSDNSTVTVSYYGPCNNASEVVLYTVNDGGHTWPGAVPMPFGPTTNQDFNASSTIWNFLKKYAKNAAYISPATASVCAGSSRTLTASGGTSYSWSTGSTNSSITVSPVADQTYNVTINFGGACSATGSRTVTITTGLTGTISPATSAVCNGGSATLTASGGASYSWSNGQTTAAVSVTPTSTATYTVTVTDAGGGCSTTAWRTVTVNPNPTVNLAGQSSICNGESVTLTASGGTSYSWSNGQLNASITVSPVSSTTYTVTATDANGCTGSESVGVTVNQDPIAAISPATVAICSGSATLTATGGSSYLWNTGGSASSITVSPLSTTTYTVTVTDVNGCTASTSRTVTVSANLTAQIFSSADSICFGDTTTLFATGGIDYSWSTSSTLPSIMVSPSVTAPYSVTVSDGGTCTASTTTTITVIPLPLANATASPTTVVQGGSTRLTASGGDSYSWSNGLTGAILTVYPAFTTGYRVTVTLNGCSSVDSVLVTVVPSGVEETSWLGSVNIYPNPTTGILNIECQAEVPGAMDIGIFSMEGKKVYDVNLNDVTTKHHLQISMKDLSLEPGVYYIRLKGEKGIVTRKSVFLE